VLYLLFENTDIEYGLREAWASRSYLAAWRERRKVNAVGQFYFVWFRSVLVAIFCRVT